MVIVYTVLKILRKKSKCLEIAINIILFHLQELRSTITDPLEVDQAIESLHSKYSKKMVS